MNCSRRCSALASLAAFTLIVPAVASRPRFQAVNVQSSRLTAILQPADLTATPTSVSSGQSSTCAVTFSSVAQSNQNVSLSTDNSSAFLTIPSSVTLVAGQSTVSFPVQASIVTATTTPTITASLNSGSASGTLTITP